MRYQMSGYDDIQSDNRMRGGVIWHSVLLLRVLMLLGVQLVKGSFLMMPYGHVSELVVQRTMDPGTSFCAVDRGMASHLAVAGYRLRRARTVLVVCHSEVVEQLSRVGGHQRCWVEEGLLPAIPTAWTVS